MSDSITESATCQAVCQGPSRLSLILFLRGREHHAHFPEEETEARKG